MRTVGMGAGKEENAAKLHDEIAALLAENTELKREIEELKKKKSPKNEKQEPTAE